MDSIKKNFITYWNYVQEEVHGIAEEKGWWDEERNQAEILCLIHAEVSEALEALRNGNPTSYNIRTHRQLTEELADVVIRVMDYAGGVNLPVAHAIIEKMEYNATRKYRHGKEL